MPGNEQVVNFSISVSLRKVELEGFPFFRREILPCDNFRQSSFFNGRLDVVRQIILVSKGTVFGFKIKHGFVGSHKYGFFVGQRFQVGYRLIFRLPEALSVFHVFNESLFFDYVLRIPYLVEFCRVGASFFVSRSIEVIVKGGIDGSLGVQNGVVRPGVQISLLGRVSFKIILYFQEKHGLFIFFGILYRAEHVGREVPRYEQPVRFVASQGIKIIHHSLTESDKLAVFVKGFVSAVSAQFPEKQIVYCRSYVFGCIGIINQVEYSTPRIVKLPVSFFYIAKMVFAENLLDQIVNFHRDGTVGL